MRAVAVAALILGYCVAVPCPRANEASEVSRNRRKALGYLKNIDGSAVLVSSDGSRRPLTNNDEYGPLLLGDRIECGRGGRVIVHVCYQRSDIVVDVSKPFAIQDRERGAPAERDERILRRQEEVRKVLDEYGATGGREAFAYPEAKGDGSTVWWPAHQSAVNDGNFDFRWLKRPSLKSFGIRVADSAGNEIWRYDIDNGSVGHLNAEAVAQLRRAALARRQPWKEVELVIAVVDSEKVQSKQLFWLVSTDEEKAIAKELAEWDRERDAFTRSLGRIYTFRKYRLLNAAAREFDEMFAHLKGAKNSCPIVQSALYANWRTGNVDRQVELQSMLDHIRHSAR